MLNHRVHDGPLGRHRHDLREALHKAGPSDSTFEHYLTFLRALTSMTSLESTKANSMLRAISKYRGNRKRPEKLLRWSTRCDYVGCHEA